MKNKLDRYFKENLRDREFTYNEAWWQQAEVMLEAERRRKRRILYACRGVAAIILTLLLNGLWFFGEKSGDDNETLTVQTLPKVKSDKALSPDLPQENQAEKVNTATAFPAPDIKSARKKKKDRFPANHVLSPEISHRKVARLAGSISSLTDAEILARETGQEKMLKNSVSFHREVSMEEPPLLPTKMSQLPFYLQNDIKVEGPEHINRGDSKFTAGIFASQLIRLHSSTGEQRIIGFSTGLTLRYAVTPSWYIASGLQYYRRSGSFDLSKSAENRRYRFGLEADTQLLRPSGLHYVSLPLWAGWQYSRHILETGLRINFLTGVRGARGTFQKTADLPPKKEFKATQEGWLVQDGFKKRTVSVSFGYHYRLNRQLSFGVSADFTPGGILDEKFKVPTGHFLLKEADRFYTTIQAIYLLK